MSEDELRYDLFVERALRQVVRETLDQVARRGLPGAHHLYITFTSKFPGVAMPDWLHDAYPEEMTIVLQYQFWDLLVEDDRFAVTLSFNDARERLIVPYAAISAFADPSVNFALPFQAMDVTGEVAEATEAEQGEPGAGAADGNVVTLDQFRKK